MKFVDRCGQRYGKLLVISKSVNDSNKTYWNCQCDCGNTTVVYAGKLTSGATQSCGCLRSEAGERRVIDRVGQRFSRLVVLERVENDKHRLWRCLCDCGNTTVADTANLANGHTRSCGCLVKDKASENFTTHGLTNTPEHRTWMSNNNRCNNENDKQYVDYGGRGIHICERWISFKNFLEDMGKKPSPQYSIDRIDNELGYSKENCRWSTAKTQANNRRSNKYLVVDGVKKTLMEWSEHYQLSYSMIQDRLRDGWSDEDAVKIKPYQKRL